MSDADRGDPVNLRPRPVGWEFCSAVKTRASATPAQALVLIDPTSQAEVPWRCRALFLASSPPASSPDRDACPLPCRMQSANAPNFPTPCATQSATGRFRHAVLATALCAPAPATKPTVE